jgi:transcriptional regulator with XRE-family HTH domain
MSPVVEKILLLMEQQGVSGTALTSALGISSSSVTEWKKGKINPSVEAIVKVAKYFNVTTDYLLYDDVLPLHSPTRFINEEVMLVNRMREMRDGGYSWDDIMVALSLPPQAVRMAQRWVDLDEDGTFVVGNAIVQEERRIALAVDKKEVAPA